MPAWDERLPRSVCVRLTRRCNAACSFCQAPPTSRDELSVDDVGRMAGFFARRGVRSLKLSGGEPTVRDDLPQVVRAVAGAGLKPVIITNGIAVSAPVLEACAVSGGELKFSVHRPSPANDLVLRRRDSFRGVVSNMAAAADRGIGISVNAVVTPGSMGFLPDLVDFGCGAGARKVSFLPVVARGRARRKSEFSFSPAGVDAVARRVRELAELYRGRIAVRLIDLHHHAYWVVENDGSLWMEQATEDADRKLCAKQHLLNDTIDMGRLS